MELSEYGLYIFKFFKRGQPVYVIIDDTLPCIKDGTGQPFPVFARCENVNLYWAPLIEKAYAKLHSRYYALEGGTTMEALSDLTNGMVEQCFVDYGEMTNLNSLFQSLKFLC